VTLEGRDLISIFDLSDREVEAIFELADDMDAHRHDCLGLAQGRVLCTLFYEPSTRTRLSFEAAMQRLGGSVLSVADSHVTSVAKGETIADTVRIIESYADAIVLRHPLEGSARVAADYAAVPIINAGDGAHEHPTQTLLDLYTIRREKGKLKDLSVALVGDLRYGRTVHSLAFGLARFGAKVTLVSPKGLELPAHLLARLEREFDCRPAQYRSLGDVVTDLDSVRRKGGGQRVLATEVLATFDALYVTRVQKERFDSEKAYQAAKRGYALTQETLARARSDALLMHPLPRVDELSYELDLDPRAIYFRQAAYGLPVRMALLVALLGLRPIKVKPTRKGDYRPEPRRAVDFRKIVDLPCPNPRCVTNQEPYLRPQFTFVKQSPRVVACAYCEHETPSPIKHDHEERGA
jgi:aspartate carbamoyltransferase catalytic subunit